MQQVVFDVPYTEERNRGTTAIRIILAIPHLILYGLWQRVAQLAAVVQWFICVFTGKRNKAIWDFSVAAEAYGSRVGSYAGLLHDVFPPFLTEQGAVPSRYSLEYDESVNRLTVALRIIWAIPALILLILIGIAAFVVADRVVVHDPDHGQAPQGDVRLLAQVPAVRGADIRLHAAAD